MDKLSGVPSEYTKVGGLAWSKMKSHVMVDGYDTTKLTVSLYLKSLNCSYILDPS